MLCSTPAGCARLRPHFNLLVIVCVFACSDPDERAALGREALIPPDALDGALVPTIGHPGWTQGTFSVTHDGAATYHLPIFTLPGRNGVEPSLALGYSSRGANGLLGVGWSLSGLSQIAACPTRPAFGEPTNFYIGATYCLDGKRIRDGHPVGDPYTEVERTSAGQFKVYTRDGLIRTYGAVVVAPSGGVHVFLLSQVEDRYGVVRATT